MRYRVLCCALLMALSGCALVQGSVEGTALRDSLSGEGAENAQARAAKSDYTVTALTVTVPSYLVVSESNTYHPAADIVWRGDPYGDRRAQVKAIMEQGLNKGIALLHGPRKVIADVVVRRFHSLTGRARYTVGGVHSITFLLTLKDAASGTILWGPRVVKADLQAFGGRKALEADRMGQTQKVRIVNHLARVIVDELSPPKTEN